MLYLWFLSQVWMHFDAFSCGFFSSKVAWCFYHGKPIGTLKIMLYTSKNGNANLQRVNDGEKRARHGRGVNAQAFLIFYYTNIFDVLNGFQYYTCLTMSWVHQEQGNSQWWFLVITKEEKKGVTLIEFRRKTLFTHTFYDMHAFDLVCTSSVNQEP